MDRETGDEIRSLDVETNIDSSPSIADGLAYVGINLDAIYALNISNGELVWWYQFETGLGATGQPKPSFRTSPTIANGVLYIGHEAGDVYALKLRTLRGDDLAHYENGSVRCIVGARVGVQFTHRKHVLTDPFLCSAHSTLL